MMHATFKGKLNKAETAIRNAYVIALYNSGKTPVEIIQTSGIPSTTVYNCIKQYVDEHPEHAQKKWARPCKSQQTHSETSITIKHTDTIVKMYQNGASYQEIRHEVGCSDGTIARVINMTGIPKRGRNNPAKKPSQTPKPHELTDAEIDRIARRVAEILAAKIAA